MGRNEIFHYFPHNVRAVTFDEANRTVASVLETIEVAYAALGQMKVMHKLKALSIN